MVTSRMKRVQRERARREGVAEFEVVCPGMLQVLSVGKGDLRITVSGTPQDIENGRRVIEEMLRKGYSIFVETDKGLTRVKRFNPKRMSYIVSELAEEPAVEEPEPPAAAKSTTHKRTTKGRRRVTEREVPVAGSRSTVIGRTSGG